MMKERVSQFKGESEERYNLKKKENKKKTKAQGLTDLWDSITGFNAKCKWSPVTMGEKKTGEKKE